MRYLWFVVAALCLLAPTQGRAWAQSPPRLADYQAPGSLIVFPYFLIGSKTVDGVSVPRTEIHITPVCPGGVSCTENQPVKVFARWVCGGSENPTTSFVCKSTNFVMKTTINGTITLDANGHSNVGSIPTPNCGRGYLMAYVVNTGDLPIKFDGLIGDGLVRTFPTGEATYSGIAVQAASDNPSDTYSVLTEGVDSFTGQKTLLLDGLPGNYAALTGQLSDTVAFDNPVGPGILNKSFLVFLTLDVQLGAPNNPTFVPMTFYNADQAPTSVEDNFVCWQQVDLVKLSPSLTAQGQTSPEGSFVTGQAVKVAISGISDFHGPVNLLGLLLARQGAKSNENERENISMPFNNGVAVPDDFLGLE